jgi:putative transposase
MERHCGLSRVVENFCLETVRTKYAQRKAEETYGIPKGELTKVPWSAPALEREWRAAHPERFPWFVEGRMSSRVPKEACRARAAGFSNYLKSRKGERKGARMGFPSWRKRKHGSRFRYDADRAKPLDARTVRLPAIGDAPKCGIDLGLKTFAVIKNSDGRTEEIHAPRLLKAATRALRRANKALARSKVGSRNRDKATKRVAKLHMRVADRRRDFLHKTTTRLTRTKSAIAVETLHVKGMVANRRLARAVADAGFGEFVRQLGYKADWYGSTVWKADRWFPSSKTCGTCGRLDRGLVLADRTWVCPGCGVLHDRDENAADNLLDAMLNDQTP